MSEKEKKIIERVAEAIPQMSEVDKGYVLGVSETLAGKNTKEKKEKELS